MLADAGSICSSPTTPTFILASKLLREIFRVSFYLPREAFIAQIARVPVDHSPMALAIPKRRSSQNFSLYRSSLASPLAPSPAQHASPAPKHERTILTRGRSISPIRRVEGRDVRKAPSRTFIPLIVPTDILDFPKVNHPRIEVELSLSAPVFVGGATVEGDVRITIDGGHEKPRRKSRSTLSISRIVISLVGVESFNGRRRIFRRLATELIDQSHPPPIEMAPTGRLPAEGSWEVLPSVSMLSFCLDLPVAMGPPSYTAKKQGIAYLLSTTVEAKVAGKQEFVRQSREIIILTVHDRKSWFGDKNPFD